MPEIVARTGLTRSTLYRHLPRDRYELTLPSTLLSAVITAYGDESGASAPDGRRVYVLAASIVLGDAGSEGDIRDHLRHLLPTARQWAFHSGAKAALVRRGRPSPWLADGSATSALPAVDQFP